MMKRRAFLSVAGALVLFPLVGAACGSDDEGSSGNEVVATTAIVGALAKEVAGDKLPVSVLVGPGVDPHDYELTAQDRKKIDGAKVILRNGGGIDAFLDKSIKSGNNKKKTTTVSDGIEFRDGEEHEGEEHKDEDEHAHEEGDPHIWHDPANVKIMVANIAEALADSDPANADSYRANATAYAKTLDDTDAEIRRVIDTIPAANRKMVTNHDAFGYSIERYGLVFVGAVIPSQSTSAEPSAKDIADLTALIKKEGVKAIFAESSLDPKVAQQLAKDTNVKTVDDLYGDSLGDPGSGAETVHGMLLANAKKIAEALR